jgi:hypothetical protein
VLEGSRIGHCDVHTSPVSKAIMKYSRHCVILQCVLLEGNSGIAEQGGEEMK